MPNRWRVAGTGTITRRAAGQQFLGIDAGTSTIKAVLFDESGRELAVARRSAGVLRPRPAWAEQDMDVFWQTVTDASRQVLAEAGDVRLVAVTAQGDGCWLVDGADRPTGPAILWNDGRATPYVRQWERDGVLDLAYRRNGSVTFPGLANAILRWMADEDPQRLARSATLLTCGGWLHLRLTGRRVADQSDASAPFLDLQSGEYSQQLLDAFDLAPARRLLPPVVSGGDTIAPMLSEVAATLGLPAGTPVMLAPYDVASCAIGLGATERGHALAVLGTTIFAGAVATDPAAESPMAGAKVALGLPGRFLRFFPTLTGVELLEWGAALSGVSDAAAFARLAEESPRGANGLLVLPYFSPAGERAPFLEPSARGSIHGLSLEHGAADVARGVLESLSFVVRDCLDATRVEMDRLLLSGGGARNRFWCSMIADVLGIPVRTELGSEAGARGAVIAALHVTDGPQGLAAFHSQVGEGEVFSPEAGAADAYEGLYLQFLESRDRERQAWRSGHD